MKKFTPIAMKCTQEDWESIRDEISKYKEIGLSQTFKEFNFLVNNWNGKGIVANCYETHSRVRKSKIYEKFDANIFLNACGIDYYEVVKSEKPSHYQTENNIDIIDFCKMYNLNFNRGNIIKYVARAGKKDDEIKDLEKALDFIQREIKYLKEK